MLLTFDTLLLPPAVQACNLTRAPTPRRRRGGGHGGKRSDERAAAQTGRALRSEESGTGKITVEAAGAESVIIARRILPRAVPPLGVTSLPDSLLLTFCLATRRNPPRGSEP